jgi:hypothetical protein
LQFTAASLLVLLFVLILLVVILFTSIFNHAIELSAEHNPHNKEESEQDERKTLARLFGVSFLLGLKIRKEKHNVLVYCLFLNGLVVASDVDGGCDTVTPLFKYAPNEAEQNRGTMSAIVARYSRFSMQIWISCSYLVVSQS